MIKVTLPDGKIAAFPDGTPESEMIAALDGYAQPADITGGDVARGMLQGATLNFGDELRAGASALGGVMAGQGSFGDLYGVTRDYERRKMQEFTQASPVASAASQIGGGLLTGIPAGAKAGASAAGQALASRVGQMGLMGRIGTQAGMGAAAGGATGAIGGVGSAESMSDVPAEALQGGAIGFGVGGLLGGATEAAMTGGRAAVEGVRRARNPSYQASKNLEKAAQRAGTTVDDMLTRAEAMGPDATLADTSEAAREMLETTTQQPGAARGEALGLLESRSRKAGQQLLSDLGPGKKFETLDALKDYRKSVASPQYKKAFDQGVPHTGNLETIFNDIEEFAPGVWDQAKKLGKLKLANADQSISGAALGEARPSLQGWQYIKERLDDMVDSAYRSGNGKAGGAIKDVRTRLLGELDTLNDDYAQARSKWAGAAQFEEMMDSAGKFMTSPAAEFENAVKGLKPVDREAVKIGAIQSIEDRIERGSWTQDIGKFFRTPAMERKMKALFNDPKEYAAFQNKLKVITEKQRTFDAVRGNSATARRLAAEKDANDWISTAMDAAGELATGGGGLARKGLLMAASKAAKFTPGMSEAARTETARRLLQQDPAMRALEARLGQGLLNAPMPAARLPLLPAELGLLSGQFSGLQTR
jgi:hypothetical protein